MTKKFIWATRVMAVVGFLSSAVLVYEVVQNVVTREQLCSAMSAENREIFAPQVQKGIAQTRQIHIKGYTDAQKHRAITQSRHFVSVLRKPVC